MATPPRASVLRKIAARRRRGERWDTRTTWTMFLAGHTAGTARLARMALPTGQRILTRREMEVLRLVATGDTDRGIADRLYVSRRTVSSHVSNILAKLEVPSRRAAVVTAARIGLL
ncbi:MAG: LuxR C-terminal-related transcriptional regulator [Chloroflexota bacterium]|nr:LuxR C-terminal-related transcriptional regulator [Chloroflexota bacterium]